ncbi:MAG: hypothetical protein ACRD4I_10300 [Candidatus Angelobacter sp.]
MASSRISSRSRLRRPALFGLHLAAEPQTGIPLDPDDITYGQARQIGLIRDGSELVPFSKHSTGTTNSVTAGGDGSSKTTATDSDTDATED